MGEIQMLFRGGPLDGLNVLWANDKPPAVLKGFITNNPAEVNPPPVGSKDLLEYHRTDFFVCDMAPEIKVVIYAWNRR